MDEPADNDLQTAVAVIAVAARTPGAADLDAFWAALVEGRDLTTRTADDRRYGVVGDTDRFDAAFFRMTPRDAQLLDPQDRVFLECVWEALEHAGYDPGTYPGAIGVYAGSSETDHLAVLRAHRHRFPDVPFEQLRMAAGRDFLTSRVAYRLNLRGPAVTVHTACSTSAVAVHLACQALLAGECDLALAGGVALRGATGGEDDDLLSPGGYCRPFDADADGMVGADGAGVVVLKRLSDALADGDHIAAVLLGSALSNDGSDKVGFAAPSVTGQVTAARTAHLVADVAPGTIGYVEAHGTGTAIGDTIEVRALSEAFGPGTPQSCILSSVKSNIGHADAAAGVLGLIKVVLALRHGLIPGTAHFRSPHPLLDLSAGPFALTGEATPWPPGDRPRRAGVHATGIGGTNAHLVVQEAPAVAASPEDGRYHLLPLSACTTTALAAVAVRLRDRLRREPVALADVAWTLQTGRAAFTHRAFVVCRDRDEAVQALTDLAERGDTAEQILPEAAEPLRVVGRQWQSGQPVDWSALHEGPTPRRVPLPAYPFERHRFAVDADLPVTAPSSAPGADADEPSTPLEKAIAEVWRDVLRVPRVGLDDEFFELGGHSLHATRVLTRLKPALGPDAPRLTIMDIFDNATIRELAALVSRAPRQPEEAR